MQDIAVGKIERRGDLCFFRFFFLPLLLHERCTSGPKLNVGVGVNRIVDAAVTGPEALRHLADGSIDDGPAADRCNIAPLQIQVALYGVRSAISVIHFLALSSCKYSFCIFKKASDTGAGIRILNKERSRFFCSCLLVGIRIS